MLASTLAGTEWTAAIAAVVAASAAVVTAAVAVCGIVLVWRELPSLRRQLAGKEYIAEELEALIREGAQSPDEGLRVAPVSAAPVLLAHVRTGRHDPVFDRIVFEFIGEVPGYEIWPLGADALSERGVQGVWGLHVRLEPCRLRLLDGPDAGELSLGGTRGSPRYPAMTDYRLVDDDEVACEWMIGTPARTHYLVLPLADPPRLVVDFFR